MQKTENESASADSPAKFSPQDMNNMLRKMEQLQLKQSQLLGYINAMNRIALLAEADPQGNILTVNEMYLKYSGFEREDLIGAKFDGLKSGRQDEDVFHSMWETISAAKVWRGLVQYGAKNGDFFWLDLTVFPQINADQKIVKYLCAGIPATHFLNEDGAPELHLKPEHAPPREDTAAELRALQHKYNNLTQELETIRSVVSRHFLQISLNADGKINSANDNFIETLGITEGNLTGKPLSDLLSSRQPSAERASFAELISAKKAFRSGIWLANNDNQHFFLYAALSPTTNSEGEVNGFQFIAADLTEMRDDQDALASRLEELERNYSALKEENAQFAAQQEEHERIEVKLFSQVSALNESALVVEIDLNGKVIFANDKLLKLLKRSRQNVLEMPFSTFVDKDAAAPAFSDVWKTLEAGRPWQGALYLNVPETDSEPVWSAFSPVKNDAGEISKYVGIKFEIGDLIRENTDIREQFSRLIEQHRNLETEALRRGKNANLAESFSGAQNLFYIECDPKGGVVEFSPQFTELTGYSRDEVIGKPIQQLVHSELTSNYFDELDFSVEEQRPFEGEVRFDTKSGSPLFARSVFIPSPASEDVSSGTVKSLHFDVSNLEEEKTTLLARYDELERALDEEKRLRGLDAGKIEGYEENLKVFREYAGITDRLLFNIELDAEGKILNINDAVAERSGFSEEEIVSQNFRNLLHERFSERERSELISSLQQKAEWQGELCLRAREGEFWLSARLFPLEQASGSVFLLSGFEITALIQAQENLRIDAENAKQEAESRNQKAQALDKQLASAREAYETRIRDLEEAAAAANSQTAEKESKCKTLEQEKTELLAQAKNANAALEKEQQKNRELIEINRRSANQTSTLEAQLEEAKSEIELLKKKIESGANESSKVRELEEDVKTLRINNQSLHDEISQLADNKSALQEQNDKRALEIERQQALAKAAEARATALATEMDDLLQEQQKMKSDDAELRQKDQLIDQLNRRVGSIEEDKENQRKAFAALSRELQQARNQIKQQESKIRAFPEITHAELVALFNENISLRSDLSAAQSELSAHKLLINHELPALRAKVKQSEARDTENEQPSGQSRELRAEIEQLQKKLTQAESEMELLRRKANNEEQERAEQTRQDTKAESSEAEQLAAELSNQQLSNTILQQRIKQYELNAARQQERNAEEKQKLNDERAQLNHQLAEARKTIARLEEQIATSAPGVQPAASIPEREALGKEQADTVATSEPVLSAKPVHSEPTVTESSDKKSYLVVSDDLTASDRVARRLEESGNSALVLETIQDALSNYEMQKHDAILVTFELPGMNAFDFLDIIRNDYDDADARLYVLITDEDVINAEDYIQQGFNDAFALDDLPQVIDRLI